MPNNNNITPYASHTLPCERMRISGTRPIVYWMTGLSGSGKSTIAALCEKKLCEIGKLSMMLDGDTVRSGLCGGLGFSAEDRAENLRRIAECAKIIASTSEIVIVCAISPTEESRRVAREIISPAAVFKEVYVKADVNVCASRDPKGLYKKAFSGEIENFTGVSAPYDIPLNPDIVLDTAARNADECSSVIVSDAMSEIYSPHELIHNMVDAALMASDEIMRIYDNEKFDIEIKSDNSPVTTADNASNKVLVSYFREKYPEYSILSEESEDDRTRLTNNAGVFIIDPLDGTKEFISHNGEFCVSIGFSHSHRVVGGVIAVPAKKIIYYAYEGLGSYKISFDEAHDFSFGSGKKLHVSERDGINNGKLIVVASRSHMDKETELLLEANSERIGDVISLGSCLKGCMIAEGLADVHYRYGAFTKEWDTAAMQIICEEAGAVFTEHSFKPLPANREDPYNRVGFMILNKPESALKNN